MIYKKALISILPMFISLLAAKLFGDWIFVPIVLFIEGILFFIFREKFAIIAYEEAIIAREMSKNVSWTILKSVSDDSTPDEKVMDYCRKEAIHMGKWYMFMALGIVVYYWVVVK